MTFMERARVFYQRGDVVRAAFVLAEGIKRDPAHEDALNWFLQIYVEEVEGPGLEQELIRVLERQADGAQLLEGVRDEMRRRSQTERLAFLERVDGLRRRAAESRLDAPSAAPPSDADSEDLDGIDPALAQRVQRRRRRAAPKPAAEPAEAPTDDNLQLPEVRRQTRRRRALPDETAVSAAQGVLALDGGERAPRDAWRGFKGVAAHLDPEKMPPLTAELDRRPPADVSAEPSAARTPTPMRPLPAVTPRRFTERTAIPVVVPTGEHDDVDEVPPPRRPRPSVEQLLALEDEDDWTFGEPTGADSGGMTVASEMPPLAARSRRRRVRRMPAVTMEPAAHAVRSVGRGMLWIVKGKRGLSLLALVGVLGATAAGYRACSGLMAGQMAEADEALARGDGPALDRALILYTELAGDDAGQLRERRDFVRALLVMEYGRAIELGDDMQTTTAFGAAALALARLSEENLALARPEADSAAETFPDDWVAHWTRGRVAVAEAAWDRAEESYVRAHEADPDAVLPVLGLIDLGLRAGRDERVEDAMAMLERLNPEHPDLPIVQGLLRYGINPLDVRAAATRLEIPEESQTGLSLQAQEWLAYLRAREALAGWRLEDVAQALVGLRRAQSGPLGVRVNLLEAVLAARRYRLDDAMAALDRAMTAAPDGSPAEALARHLRGAIATDLGRPELALEGLGPDEALLRARLLVEAAREEDALSALGVLMERADTQAPALRLLVDYHLRRGVPDRATMRAAQLQARGDQAYAAARMAAAEGTWSTVRDQAEEALRENSSDIDSLHLWARATAELGLAERALERVDERAARSVLVGSFDEIRLDVLLASGRAPRETLAEFVGLLSGSQPTSMSRLSVLARAYESIGDLERAAEAAQQVLAGEPNNRVMHALLGRVFHTTGQGEDSTRHLRAYLALAPATESTDWARAILGEPPAAATATP